MYGKEAIIRAVERYRKELISLGRYLHDNPELSGAEFRAAAKICSFLEKNGFTEIRKEVAGLPTAFTASRTVGGPGGFHVGFCAEYDALPDIGHACGHNLIAGASLAAALALGECGTMVPFKVSLIGTPDEEVKGAKVDLIKNGVFADVDVAMMFHPGIETRVHVRSLASRSWEFTFFGKNAHAASEPFEGRNALDGVILTFTNINALRQYVKDDVRIHGIIKEGGKATNIIPARACAEICVRSLDNTYLDEVENRVTDCARGAALASGTTLERKPYGNFYDAIVSNRVLADLFQESLNEIGFVDISKNTEGLGSIDMGNVSRVVPAIHPVLAVTERNTPGHTVEFAEACNTDTAYEVMLSAGKAMALTALRVIESSGLRNRIREEFKQSLQ